MAARHTLAHLPIVTLLTGCAFAPDSVGGDSIGGQTFDLESAPNDRGVADSFHTSGSIDRDSAFFTPNGGNGRTCETCHLSDQGWAVSPEKVSELFTATDGLAPIFDTIDEGTSAGADVSTLAARRKTFDTLLSRGLTRFPVALPPDAEFTVVKVDDPTGASTPANPVHFRRVVPISNEALVPQVTWTIQVADLGVPDVPTFLAGFAIGASQFHLQIPSLPFDLALQIRDFQLGLFFAQSVDADAGALDAAGARGGPVHLASQPFYVGINDIQGNDPLGHPFTRKVFDLFDAWENADADRSLSSAEKKQAQARASIQRGQELFNFRTFTISGVNGLNDLLGQASIQGTCGTCHNTPNVGGHSVPRFFDTGSADASGCPSGLPIMKLEHRTTHATRKVCDLGRAGSLVPTGRWADVGAFRAPPLRGLAARSPYFHDGRAEKIDALVDFYVERFKINLTASEKVDLGNFLEAL